MFVWPVASEPLKTWFQKADVIPKLLKQYFCSTLELMLNICNLQLIVSFKIHCGDV